MAFGDPPRTVVVFPKGMPRLPNLAGSGMGWVALLLVAAAALFGTFYTVDPEERGVVTRFGKYVRTTEPGLHMKIPLFIERVMKVPVERQLKEEFGFRTVRPGVRSEYTSSGFETESNMLSGDLNTAVVEWVVQYRVEDPYLFLFRVRSVRDTLRDLSEAVMRYAVGDRTVDEVLTVGRQEVSELVAERLQELCTQYDTGIRIEQVVLQNVTPPEPVRPSFNEVNQAEQEKETLINQAQSEYNKVIFRSRGVAEKTIQTAEGYALDRVNRAKGEADRFESLYAEFRRAPDVTRKRIYLETLGKVLPGAGRKVIVDEEAGGVLPLLNLDGVGGAQ